MFTHNMAASNKMQMVLSHDSSIIVSYRQQPPVVSAWEPSVNHFVQLLLNFTSNGQNIMFY